MAQGRDVAVGALIFLGLLFLNSEVACAATFTVGDDAGWSPSAGTWADGKKFAPGDILVFNYDPATYDVVKVDKAGFTSCTPGAGQTFKTGKDEIVLDKGCNFFICSNPENCQAGMKIDVSAKAPK